MTGLQYRRQHQHAFSHDCFCFLLVIFSRGANQLPGLPGRPFGRFLRACRPRELHRVTRQGGNRHRRRRRVSPRWGLLRPRYGRHSVHRTGVSFIVCYGRCITQLAKMSIDPGLFELPADVVGLIL